MTTRVSKYELMRGQEIQGSSLDAYEKLGLEEDFSEEDFEDAEDCDISNISSELSPLQMEPKRRPMYKLGSFTSLRSLVFLCMIFILLPST